MNIKQLAANFAAQNKDNGKAGNVYFKRNVVYSYGAHFPMAMIINYATKRAVINTDKYSQSTSRQQSVIKAALISAGYALEHTDTATLRNVI